MGNKQDRFICFGNKLINKGLLFGAAPYLLTMFFNGGINEFL